MRRLNYPRALEIQFEEIFQVRFRDFWDGITGFDIIKFDDNVLKSKDGESCRDVIVSKYGNEAALLIEKLLKPTRV